MIDNEGNLDIDHLSPEQQRVYRKAFREWRDRGAYEMETLTKLLDLDIEPSHVSDDVMALSRMEWQKKRGIWNPSKQGVTED